MCSYISDIVRWALCPTLLYVLGYYNDYLMICMSCVRQSVEQFSKMTIREYVIQN